jgi:hypothetical protein
MEKCQRCDSERLASVSSKSSDLNFVQVGKNEHDGYMPDDLGIGGGDYVDFAWCLECGQIQGNWSVEPELATGAFRRS